MRKSSMALAALFVAAGFTGTVSAAEVTVLRGDTSEAVATGRTGPTVLRGGGSMVAGRAVETEPAAPRRVVAGSTLWRVDDSGRPDTACFLIRTEYVGKRKIRCTSQHY